MTPPPLDPTSDSAAPGDANTPSHQSVARNNVIALPTAATSDLTAFPHDDGQSPGSTASSVQAKSPRRRPGRPPKTAADRAADKNKDPRALTLRQQRILDVIIDSTNFRGFAPSIREIAQATGLSSTSSVSYHLQILKDKGYLTREENRPRAVSIRNLDGIQPPPTAAIPQPEATAEPANSPATSDASAISDARSRQRATATGAPQAAASKVRSPRQTPNLPGSPGWLDEELPEATYVPVVGSIAAGNPILAEQSVEAYFPLPEQLTGTGDFFLLQVQGDSMMDAAILNGDWVVIRSQQTANNGDFVAAMIDGEATVKEYGVEDNGVWLIPHNPAYDYIPARDATIMGKVVTVLRKI